MHCAGSSPTVSRRPSHPALACRARPTPKRASERARSKSGDLLVYIRRLDLGTWTSGRLVGRDGRRLLVHRRELLTMRTPTGPSGPMKLLRTIGNGIVTWIELAATDRAAAILTGFGVVAFSLLRTNSSRSWSRSECRWSPVGTERSGGRPVVARPIEGRCPRVRCLRSARSASWRTALHDGPAPRGTAHG